MSTPKIPQTALRAMLDYLDLMDERAGCCYPYDCMHHEQCGEDNWYCGRCQERQEANRRIPEKYQRVDFWEYARKVHREESQTVLRDLLDHAKELESIGDHRGAARLLGDEESVY